MYMSAGATNLGLQAACARALEGPWCVGPVPRIVWKPVALCAPNAGGVREQTRQRSKCVCAVRAVHAAVRLWVRPGRRASVGIGPCGGCAKRAG